MRVLTTLLLVAVAQAAVADIHRWQDAEGRVHFGDRPPAGADARTISVRTNLYAGSSATEAAAVSVPTVILYSTQRCGYCRQARSYFQSKGVVYQEYDVELTSKGRRDYAQLHAKGVPVILVGDQRMDGFSESVFERIYARP